MTEIKKIQHTYRVEQVIVKYIKAADPEEAKYKFPRGMVVDKYKRIYRQLALFETVHAGDHVIEFNSRPGLRFKELE